MVMRTRREIEEKAASLLAKHGVGEAPVRVDAIAKAEGVAIVESSI
jgi:hypothetical protein